jgi:hypothetical protein
MSAHPVAFRQRSFRKEVHMSHPEYITSVESDSGERLTFSFVRGATGPLIHVALDDRGLRASGVFNPDDLEARTDQAVDAAKQMYEWDEATD